MKRLLATAAVATLLAGGAVAQTTTPAGSALATGDTAAPSNFGDMHGNLAGMRETVAAELARHSIAADVGTLTLDQLTEMFSILTDDGMSEQDTQEQLRLIVEGS